MDTVDHFKLHKKRITALIALCVVSVICNLETDRFRIIFYFPFFTYAISKIYLNDNPVTDFLFDQKLFSLY